MSTYIVREGDTDLFAVEAPTAEDAAWAATQHPLSPWEGAIVVPEAQHPAWQDYLEYCRWGGAGGPLGSFVSFLNRRRAQEHRFEENRRTGSTRDHPTLDDFMESALILVEA